MDRDLDPALLRVFLTCVTSGSISYAAQALGRSQPTVSERLRRLEDLVGERLVERGARGIALTAAGERLLPFARQLVQLSEDALAAARSARNVGRRIGIGLLDDLTQGPFPAALTAVRASHPGLTIEVVSLSPTETPSALQQGRVQVVMGDLDGIGLEPELTWREPLAWMAATGFDAGVRPLPLILCSRPCRFRAGVLAALAAAGIPHRIAFESTTLTGLNAAVSAGLGVATLLGRFAMAGLAAVAADARLPSLPAIPLGIARQPSTRDDAIIDDIVRSLATLARTG